MIKRPPTGMSNIISPGGGGTPVLGSFNDYLAMHRALDDKGRYLPYDELRHRWPKGMDPGLCWTIVKSARAAQCRPILSGGTCVFFQTPLLQRTISLIDRQATTAALQYMTGKIGEDAHFNYLLGDLIEDEAIGSSQLEGAATTTRIAKDMLKRHRLPRTPDERMILGNFRMMNLAWERRHEPLSMGLIARLHEVGVSGIDDDVYRPGAFRLRDDVVVVDDEGHTLHQPPAAIDLESRLAELCQWANEAHDDPERDDYLHPLTKAIALHFAIGFEHPFCDGNGRVARALFYWCMFRHDYSAFRYIAISVLLRNAPLKYGRAYLHVEADGLDLTYFIDHQCSVIVRAVKAFTEAYRQSLVGAQALDQGLWQSGLLRELTDKQRTILQVERSGAQREFTAMTVKENLGCSYNTASTVLNGLVSLKLFAKRKDGREWVFFASADLTATKTPS